MEQRVSQNDPDFRPDLNLSSIFSLVTFQIKKMHDWWLRDKITRA